MAKAIVMSDEEFRTKYGDLDTYRKFIEKISELIEAQNYYNNKTYLSHVKSQISYMKRELKEYSNFLDKFAEFCNNIYDIERIIPPIEIKDYIRKAEALNKGLTGHLEQISHETTSSKAQELHEMEIDLLRFFREKIESSKKVDNKVYVQQLHAQIVPDVICRNINYNIASGTQYMEEVYKVVMKDVINSKENVLDEYKQYKKEQQEKLTKSANNKTTTKVEPQSITESKER